MERAKSLGFKKGAKLGFILIVWMATAWLLYPLITLDSADMENAKEYLYRATAGIAIMLILFGKTIFDLLFPQTISQKKALLNTIFLTLYCVVIACGILFMVSRMIVLYLKSGNSGSPF
jgi:succinate-acetate transporter protein